MRDENDRLRGILLNLREEVVAFRLERLVADCQHLIENENVTLRFDGDGKGETHLHARGVVLQLLVHKIAQLCELDDVVVHGIDLVT